MARMWAFIKGWTNCERELCLGRNVGEQLLEERRGQQVANEAAKSVLCDLFSASTCPMTSRHVRAHKNRDTGDPCS